MNQEKEMYGDFTDFNERRHELKEEYGDFREFDDYPGNKTEPPSWRQFHQFDEHFKFQPGRSNIRASHVRGVSEQEIPKAEPLFQRGKH